MNSLNSCLAREKPTIPVIPVRVQKTPLILVVKKIFNLYNMESDFEEEADANYSDDADSEEDAFRYEWAPQDREEGENNDDINPFN